MFYPKFKFHGESYTAESTTTETSKKPATHNSLLVANVMDKSTGLPVSGGISFLINIEVINYFL